MRDASRVAHWQLLQDLCLKTGHVCVSDSKVMGWDDFEDMDTIQMLREIMLYSYENISGYGGIACCDWGQRE